jgi:hypothetical protein
MGFINQMIRAATWPAFRQLKRATADPKRAQARVWTEVRGVLDKSSYWGAQARGRKLEDFPISDFETYRAALDQMQSQRISALSGEEIIYWAESGGTSGPAKLFPLTDRYRRQFQRTMGPYLHANATRFPGFADKPVIYLASVLPQRKSPAGIDIGYISIFNYRHIPAPLKKLYVFPLDVFTNSETFREWAPVFAAASDISAIFAITPIKVEQFWDLIWRERDRILRTLRTTGSRVPVTPERLAHLERVFAQTQPSLQDLWPSLSVIGCWKTSSCALQLEQLERHTQGRTKMADAIYSATEGWTTVPIQGETGGVLHPGAHVVEFHEAGQTPQAASLLKPWQLEAGKDYEIFLTTAMGFVRYRLYDVLRCSGHWQRAPILEFKQKAGNQISLGTMRVTEDELLTCMRTAGFRPQGPFCYAPNRKGNGLIFVSGDPRDADPQAQARIDEALQALSFYYRRDVKEGVVKPIEVLSLPPTHSLWQRPGHAQEKPRILVQEFPA